MKKKKIKTMNVKMVINSKLSTIESKKQTKQNRNRIIDTEIIWRVITWGGKNGGKGAGTKKYK